MRFSLGQQSNLTGLEHRCTIDPACSVRNVLPTSFFLDKLDAEAVYVDTSWLSHYFEDRARITTDQYVMGASPENDPLAARNGKRLLTRILKYVIVGGAMAVRQDDLKDVKLAIFDLEAAGEDRELTTALRSLATELETMLTQREQALEAVSQEQLGKELERIRTKHEDSRQP